MKGADSEFTVRICALCAALIIAMGCGCGTKQTTAGSPQTWHPAEFMGQACRPDRQMAAEGRGPDRDCEADHDGYAYARFAFPLHGSRNCAVEARTRLTEEIKVRAVTELCEISSGVDRQGLAQKSRALLARSRDTGLFACCWMEDRTEHEDVVLSLNDRCRRRDTHPGSSDAPGSLPNCMCNFYFQYPRSGHFVRDCGESAL